MKLKSWIVCIMSVENNCGKYGSRRGSEGKLCIDSIVLRKRTTKSSMLSAHILVLNMHEFAQYHEAILQPPNIEFDDRPTISAHCQIGILKAGCQTFLSKIETQQLQDSILKGDYDETCQTKRLLAVSCHIFDIDLSPSFDPIS